MMLGMVGSDGKRMPPFWFKEGLKIMAEVYLEVLQDVVKPWLDSNYPNGNYIFQQDSAPAHKAKKVQAWCQKELAGFWPWEFWLPSSPDLNPLDYSVWSVLERKACARPHPNKDSLKAAVEQAWAEMSTTYVVQTCKAFRGRMERMLAANGSHFE